MCEMVTCANCNRSVRADYIRGGVCNTCKEYKRTKGVDRPVDKPFRKYKESMPCAHCGRQEKYLSFGLCTRCNNYRRRTGNLPRLDAMTHCSNCGRDIKPTKRGRGLCQRCNAYMHKHGTNWTPEVSRRSKYEPAPMCECCKERPAENRTPKPMCDRCILYWRRTGKYRPRWRDAEKCKVCGKPRQEIPHTFVMGRCVDCYEHWRRHGRKKERPAHMWGKGEHGWCDCGQPATRTIEIKITRNVDVLPVCESCYAEEMRQRRIYGDVTQRVGVNQQHSTR